jgi:endonuclease/exonuclease/phosphatase family metal-dependent hydrolase
MAIRRQRGRFRGCDADLCRDGLAGARVAGCGSGSRVGRGVIELAEGGTVTAVSVHGTSGASQSDMSCRSRQFEQIFVDLGLGDGPAANGTHHLVLGDFNTDPGRLAVFDRSARTLLDFVGPDKPFRFLTAVGPDALPTYAGAVNIDHIISDTFTGSCWAAGVDAGRPPVSNIVYFDHRPVVCDLTAPNP